MSSMSKVRRAARRAAERGETTPPLPRNVHRERAEAPRSAHHVVSREFTDDEVVAALRSIKMQATFGATNGRVRVRDIARFMRIPAHDRDRLRNTLVLLREGGRVIGARVDQPTGYDYLWWVPE